MTCGIREKWLCELFLIDANFETWRNYERRNNFERISKNGMGSG